MTERREDLVLYAAADILFWLLANNPPQRGPLYWDQLQWDECNAIREQLKKMADVRNRRFLRARKHAAEM